MREALRFGSVNVGGTYTPDEEEFIKAVEEWRKRNHRRFLNSTDYLAVARSLGYAKAAPPTPTPARTGPGDP